MRTEHLIQAMQADATRTRPAGAVLPWAILGAGVFVALFVLSVIGVRPDLGAVLMQARVLVKLAFPAVLAVAAFGAVLRLATPGEDVGNWRLGLLAVPLILAGAVFAELTAMPSAGWMPAMMGHTNRFCVVVITLMSLPLLAGALWALRRGASTRPTRTGAFAGLLAGSVAASVYAFHCNEDSPLFYAVWYVLAILVVTGLGALLGRRLLRW